MMGNALQLVSTLTFVQYQYGSWPFRSTEVLSTIEEGWHICRVVDFTLCSLPSFEEVHWFGLGPGYSVHLHICNIHIGLHFVVAPHMYQPCPITIFQADRTCPRVCLCRHNESFVLPHLTRWAADLWQLRCNGVLRHMSFCRVYTHMHGNFNNIIWSTGPSEKQKTTCVQRSNEGCQDLLHFIGWKVAGNVRFCQYFIVTLIMFI